jgi:hypothetical protein
MSELDFNIQRWEKPKKNRKSISIREGKNYKAMEKRYS